MTSWKGNLDIDDLEEPYSTLAEKLGLDVALEVIELFQGQQVYFPRVERVCNFARKKLIRSEFNGYNYHELAQKYGFTERYVRIICEDLVKRERAKPIKDQLSIFDAR